MKKMLAMLLTISICLSLAACGSGAASAQPESSNTQSKEASSKTGNDSELPKFKIAVAESQPNDEAAIRRLYFSKYIAPKYNVEFIFSEAIRDINSLVSFIENAADAGADALIDYSTTDYEGAARETKKRGMKYVYNGPAQEVLTSGQYDNFIAAYGSNQKQTGALFSEYLKKSTSATGEEGFFLCTIDACNGNPAQTIISTAVLETLRDIYGLTFQQEISELVTSISPTYATNDKGINIYIYPGNNATDSWLPGLSQELQTGNYGFLISSGQSYTNSSVVVDEVERAMNKNIKVMSVGEMSSSLLDAYNTKDLFGNPSLDFVTVKASSQHAGIMFALTYNALTGCQANNMTSDGQYARIVFNQFGLTDEEMITNIAGWDNAENGTWVLDYDIVDQMLAMNHPDLTSEDIQEIVNGITYEATLERLRQ